MPLRAPPKELAASELLEKHVQVRPLACCPTMFRFHLERHVQVRPWPVARCGSDEVRWVPIYEQLLQPQPSLQHSTVPFQVLLVICLHALRARVRPPGCARSHLCQGTLLSGQAEMFVWAKRLFPRIFFLPCVSFIQITDRPCF